MNIETNIKDVSVSPLDSNGSKGSFGSDDSLEYSNDDRSVSNKINNAGKGVEFDRLGDKYLPPKYPLSSFASHNEANLVTPKRKPPDNAERLPGPLNLFSPGLSPIGHTNHSHYDTDDLTEGVFSGTKRIENRPEDTVYIPFDANLKGSVDSLEMTSPGFNHDNGEGPDDARPHYQFWRSKLFSNDLAIDSTLEINNNVEKQSMLNSGHEQKAFIRSNSNSFDSDFNLTPRHSLIYPTTDALYERSAALSPKSADVSMDSDLHITKQSLVYPTTQALYERSAQHNTNTSTTSESNKVKHSPDSRRPEHYGRSPSPAADVSIDSDIQVTHQSLVYPTTNSLFEKSTPRSTDVSLDSDMQVTKQSLVYPTSAAVFERSLHKGRNSSFESGTSIEHQSFLRPPAIVLTTRDGTSLDVSQLSMLDRSSAGEPDFGDSVLGQSLHSISLLPSSPASAAPTRSHQSMFPPPHPSSGISPSSQRGAATSPHVGVHPRRAGSVSNSDTEYTRSASKLRSAEQMYRQSGSFWKEAEDLAPSGAFSTAHVPGQRLNMKKELGTTVEIPPAPMASSHRSSPPTDLNDELSASPAGPPSPSSVSAGSPSAAAHRHQYTTSPAANSLVVGALYTLQVDNHGRPAFVPVILDQYANNVNISGEIIYSPPNVKHRHVVGTPHGNFGGLEAGGQSTYGVTQPGRKSTHFSSPTYDQSLQFGLHSANSNHIDVEKVLDRALHRGSLSEEKLNRWSGDTAKRNSPPSSLKEIHGVPPITPVRHAHHPTTATSRIAPSSTSKSPFRLSMGADGRDHLQLSTEYYKERLLVRNLTSVLNTP